VVLGEAARGTLKNLIKCKRGIDGEGRFFLPPDNRGGKQQRNEACAKKRGVDSKSGVRF